MSNISRENLVALFAGFEKEPKQPIAFVVRPEAYLVIRENSTTQKWNPCVLSSPSIYIDLHQQEDVLAFFDQLALNCYLNRLECPEAFAVLAMGDKEEAKRIISAFFKREADKIRNNSEKENEMEKKTIHFRITQKDIDNGKGGNCGECAVALAISRRFKIAISVGTASFQPTNFSMDSIKLPFEIINFVRAFDLSKRKDAVNAKRPDPTTFKVDISIKWLETFARKRKDWLAMNPKTKKEK